MILHTRAGDLDLSQGPKIMGILNLTPDSFSDGGQLNSPEAAIARAEVMAEQGADLLDIGGESSRPGAALVSVEEELGRVLPAVKILAQRLPNMPLSIDTVKAGVAQRCLEAGASMINDISAGEADPLMFPVVKEHGVPLVLMHRQGTPQTMQDNPTYDNVVEDIKNYLARRAEAAQAAGIAPENILVDPGIGFGKTLQHNLDILRHLAQFKSLGFPLLLGASRKSLMGALLDRATPPAERDPATLATSLWGALQGVDLLRVHDVAGTRQGLTLWRAVAQPSQA